MSETKTTPEAEEKMANEAETQEQATAESQNFEEAVAEESGMGQEDQPVATDWEDRYLRLYAEFDNYRKRTNREHANLIATAGKRVLENLLPVVDDFERGLKVETEDVSIIREGQQLVFSKLVQILENQGLKSMEVKIGDAFDTDRCEAITNIPHPELKGKVVDVIEQGYTLHDTVVRFAKVVVGA